MWLQVQTVDARDQEALARRQAAYQRRQRRYKFMLPFLLIMVFIAWAFTSNYIPSESMEPTLKPGDHIITMRTWLAFPMGRLPGRGDIIVFRAPKAAEKDNQNAPQDPNAAATAEASTTRNKILSALQQKGEDLLIKRVIGLPGETVQIRDRTVYINGRPLREDYATLPEDDSAIYDYRYAVDEPLKVEEGHVFVLGDNRNNSDDGRFWGTLDVGDIVGKYLFVLFHERKNGLNSKLGAEEQKASGQNP
jgi:signal peptidase I